MVQWETINIINAYALLVELRDTFEKKSFWKILKGLVQGFAQEEKILTGRDLNGHVGSEVRQFTRTHGGFGFRELNEKG
ncbi:hypothetical protein JHK86_005006 [Glycine max]|nr:hypothetical protein JHK86_005006 [Glycine max]